jgi:hypothetical protein
MDPLSVTASIIAVLQLTSKVLSYLNDVKGASEERKLCAIETSNIYNLLLNLRFQLEKSKFTQESSVESWYTAVRALAVEEGPFDQFKSALHELKAKLTDGGRLKKARDVLTWNVEKGEFDKIFDRIERLKSLVMVALQLDHL